MQELQENLQNLTARNLIVVKNGEELARTSTQILGDSVPTDCAQGVVPNNSFAHLQSHDQGKSASFGSSNDEPCEPWSLVCSHPGGEVMSQSPSDSQSLPTTQPGQNTGSWVAQQQAGRTAGRAD